MRKGYNPNKDKILPRNRFWHQIVLPVFIPYQEGYFKDAFKIFKICLNSIFKTVNYDHTYITIVNNGSCKEIENYLNNLKDQKKIDEIINTSNIGKLNAIFKGIVGHNFDFITIADADTLFLSGWQQETIKVFNNYPKAGSVGLVPQFNMYSNYCSNVLFDNFFNKNMRFFKVKEPEEMRKFYLSIGWNMQKDHYYLKHILGIQEKNVRVYVGSSHFVATYRKEILEPIKRFFPAKMGAKSERVLDKAAIEKDLWKLTTAKNFAYHMGNSYEKWMDDIQFSVRKNNLKPKPLSKLDNVMLLRYLIKNKIFKKILRLSFFNNRFFARKGLPPKIRKEYGKIYY